MFKLLNNEQLPAIYNLYRSELILLYGFYGNIKNIEFIFVERMKKYYINAKDFFYQMKKFLELFLLWF